MKRLAGLLALLWFSSADAKTLRYLYIEANEGSASGGHVALQLDDTVFHYQYSDGLIRLTRDEASDFDFDYRYRQNRNLHVADIEVSDDTHAKLLDHFQRRFWEQDRQFRHLRALENDGHLLRWLLSLKTAAPALPHPALQLPGAGLFYAAGDFDKTPVTGPCQTREAAASVLGQLRNQLRQQHGEAFLAGRARALATSIRRLSPEESSVQSSSYTFSQRYLDLLNGALALRVLQSAKPLAANACHSLDSADGDMDDAQRQSLRLYRRRLLRSAGMLLSSKRPDWGQALLIAMARLVAAEQSLLNQRWVFLDDFDPATSVISLSDYANQSDAMRQQHLAAQQRWRRLWRELSPKQALDDLSYTDLEIAANRYHAWQSSRTSQTLRYIGQLHLPLRPLPLPAWLVPDLSVPRLQQALLVRQGRLSELAEALERQYAYRLLSRNCVTELFRGIQQAMGAEAETSLGGVIDPDLNPIPFRAFASVQQHYPVSRTRILPSYRRQQLAKRHAEEFAPWVFARESNVLTAELYRYNPDDAAFLFFTDDSLLPRPLFGAFNLLTGLGQGLWGLLQSPFDEGSALRDGGRGILMSLPELVFVNIRKGSYKFVLPAESPPLSSLP
ncbi:hypothetical protein NP590_15175 [Methylomonas sp. SURF-2]|uniref:DUF4105 domain-containing protein n=1 Tax=Methylomonas subterranea TaxID=2952225 RepID=A0ABT1TL23_9GAMM|nr:hypothetical protein [Methylomonas sp. SURF-2]MCQ8105454.1 hypothetical protein [Methylomonas sp. SURF-2]